jgi:hypothetical protein
MDVNIPNSLPGRHIDEDSPNNFPGRQIDVNIANRSQVDI